MLSDYLLMHAHNYLKGPRSQVLTLPANRAVREEEILSRVYNRQNQKYILGRFKRIF